MKKIVIDLGNSETRVSVITGNTVMNLPLQNTKMVDNRYSKVPPEKVAGYLKEGTYTASDSHIFTVDGDYYCTGKICSSEFSTTCMRPTALDKKYDAITSKLAIRNAFILGYQMIMEMENCTLEEIDENWEVTILLPPMDIDMGSAKMAEMVKEIKEVDSLLPRIQKNVNIMNVKVIPEALAALIATCFAAPGVIRPGYEYLLNEDALTLIFDIGAGTTDFILAKGARIINTSRFTRNVGGNNVHQRVRMLLKERGIQLSDKAVRQGTETGFITVGNSTMDITKFIAVAKADVGRQLADALIEFFENNMIDIQSINNVLAAGGGAETPENDKISPLSDYIIAFLAEKSPNINVIDQPEFETGAGSKPHPRVLNIVGAGIISQS